MKKRYLYFSLFAIVFSMAYSNCGNSGISTSANTSSTQSIGGSCSTPTNGVASLVRPTTTSSVTGQNILTISVSAALTNQPTISARICVPGTTQCQTISGLLLDTGSTGLRIFSGALGLPLPQVEDSLGNSVGTCAAYADGTYQWGPVKTADLYLGGDEAANIPIEVIDANFGDSGAACAANAGPGAKEDSMLPGYNGIIGLQFFQQDCGAYCTSSDPAVGSAKNGVYYGCCNGSCHSELVTTAMELASPVGSLNRDNNGEIIEMPSVSTTGGSASGTLVLGIGTQANNSVSATHTFLADPTYGVFYTSFNGSKVEATIDSGSVGLYFADKNLPLCSNGVWYCPLSTTTLSATMSDIKGANALSVNFYVANESSLNGAYSCFNDLAGSTPSAAGQISFFWGFPFFLGRNVYLGMENTSSSIGAGPYWAF